MATITTTSQLATSSPLKRLISGHPIVAYFVIAFVGTWVFILPFALSRGANGLGILPFRSDIALLIAFVLANAAGPALASLGVTAITSGRAGVGLLLRRCVQWRVGIWWYLIALCGFFAIWGVEFSVLYGLNLPLALLMKWTLFFTMFLPNTMLTILTASFAEELGWRGFALPRLQQRYGPVLGTVILGTLHGLWHLPAFFTGLLGPFILTNFVSFLFVAIASTFLYTWIFNHTKGSVLLATLTHGFGDTTNSLILLLIPAQLVIDPGKFISGWAHPLISGGWNGDNIVIFGVFVVLLLIFTRGRLGYQPERNAQLFEVPQPAEVPQFTA